MDSLDNDTEANANKQVQVSKHKLDELAGRHAEEPLLKENPGRFVLFPIQDNDVSRYMYNTHHIFYVQPALPITTILTHTPPNLLH